MDDENLRRHGPDARTHIPPIAPWSVSSHVCGLAAGTTGLTALTVEATERTVHVTVGKGRRRASADILTALLHSFRGDWRDVVTDRFDEAWKLVDDGVPGDPGC